MCETGYCTVKTVFISTYWKEGCNNLSDRSQAFTMGYTGVIEVKKKKKKALEKKKIIGCVCFFPFFADGIDGTN